MRRKLGGGGYEEVKISITSGNYKYSFKLVKTGKRVDVYQIPKSDFYIDTLPHNFRAEEFSFVGLAYRDSYMDGAFTSSINMFLIGDFLFLEPMQDYYGDTKNIKKDNYKIDQLYIGSYITKE